MSVRISITTINGPGQSALHVRQGVIDTMAVVARTWHDRYLPNHFTVAGGKKYGYQPRLGDGESSRIPNPGYSANHALGFSSPKLIENWRYSWRKRKLKRHNRPLVWSGRSEEMALAVVNVRVRRRKAGVVEAAAAMKLPEYFFQYLKPGTHWRRGFLYDERGNKYRAMMPFVVRHMQPNKYDELTRVTPDEAAALTLVADVELGRRLGMRAGSGPSTGARSTVQLTGVAA